MLPLSPFQVQIRLVPRRHLRGGQPDRGSGGGARGGGGGEGEGANNNARLGLQLPLSSRRGLQTSVGRGDECRRVQKECPPPPSCLKFLTVLDLKSMFAKCDKHYPSRSGQTTSLATAITNFTKPATMINFGPSNIDQNFCQVRKIEA